MPIGAMLMALMIGWELKPEFALKEIHNGNNAGWFTSFYTVCMKYLVPVIMAFVFVGQLESFFCNVPSVVRYLISLVVLVIFWVIAARNEKK